MAPTTGTGGGAASGALQNGELKEAVKEKLVAAEEARRAKPEQRLPGTRQIADDFGVSRHAVRKAMKELKAEGLLFSPADPVKDSRPRGLSRMVPTVSGGQRLRRPGAARVARVAVAGARRAAVGAPTGERAAPGRVAGGTRASASGGRPVPAAAWALYVISGVSLAPSLDTSWRFFGERLGIVGWERGAMFAVLELMLIFSAVSMSANAASTGHPGPARVLVWAACGASAYMALLVSGPFVGGVRIMLGPVMGLLALHFALGVQVRARRGAGATVWARIGRELRERVLSRLGLADDARDALARTRDRHAVRAARLALASGWAPFRASRLARAVERSNVALDPGRKARMLAGLAARRHAKDLTDLCQPSPWS